MTRVAASLLLIAAMALGTSGAFAAPSRTPIRFTAGPQEYNTGANRPWLDQTCYDDDHGVSFTAAGWLDGTWSWTSTLPMCGDFDHHIKVIAQWSIRDAAVVSVVDHNGTSLPVRYDNDASVRWVKGKVDTAKSCNTDVGYLYVVRSGQTRAPVTWSIATSEPTFVVISGAIAETPSPVDHGGEGSWDHCLFPPPGGLNPQDPFGGVMVHA